MLGNCFGILETWFRDPKEAGSGLKCWWPGGTFKKNPEHSWGEAKHLQFLHSFWVVRHRFRGWAAPNACPQPWAGPRSAAFETTQGIMKLKNTKNTPSLWGYCPTGLVPLIFWGHKYGVRMRYGVRDDLCWQELLCCSWWNTAILNSPKLVTYPIQKLDWIKWNVLAIFLVGSILI